MNKTLFLYLTFTYTYRDSYKTSRVAIRQQLPSWNSSIIMIEVWIRINELSESRTMQALFAEQRRSPHRATLSHASRAKHSTLYRTVMF